MYAINLFPVITEDNRTDLFELHPISWTYTREGNVHELQLSEDGVVKDKDKQHAYWNPDNYDICYDFILQVNDVAKLFGSGKYAVACNNSTIGIATLWHSKNSFQRGVIEHSEFGKRSGEQKFRINGCLPKGTFRDTITLETILYISKPGIPNHDELHFANKRGCIIGTLLTNTLIVDGDGSVFPTTYVSAGASSPLWTISCNWDEPMSDQLVDCVSLNINRDNKLFKYLNNDRDNSDFDSALLQEVIASALTIIIEKLRGEGVEVDDMDRHDPCEGSVAMMVKYMQNAHNCSFGNPQDTSESIHKMVENTL